MSKLAALFLLLPFAGAAVVFSPVRVLGSVSSPAVDENSGLAASRRHPGLLYGHNDKGGHPRVFLFDPATGSVNATLTIAQAHNYDWEDVCVGVCGPDDPSWCLYIGEIGDHGGDGARNLVYKVREPAVVQDAALPVLDTLSFTWSEPDAESLMVDPQGDLYVISKVKGGNALFAQLPRDGWGATTPVPIPSHMTASINLHTTHHDPQGADLSPDGRQLLVKTEEGVLYYRFTTPNLASEMASWTPQDVTTYVRRKSGEAVAWNVDGTAFYTLPEGLNPVFNMYRVDGCSRYCR